MKIFVLFAAILLLVSSSELSVGCRDCEKSCSNGNKCYFLTGSGFNFEICSNLTSCPSNQITLYDIYKCKADISGNLCQKRVCALAKIKQCVQSTNNCPTTETITTCGSCSPMRDDCTHCHSNNFGANQCYTAHECDWQIKATRGPCQNGVDGNGNTCSCCVETQRVRGAAGYCASKFPLLVEAQQDLEAWAQSQSLLKFCGILAMLVMMIFY